MNKELLLLKVKHRFARVVKINDPQLIDITGLAGRMTYNDRYFSWLIRSFTDGELLEEMTRRGLSTDASRLVESPDVDHDMIIARGRFGKINTLDYMPKGTA